MQKIEKNNSTGQKIIEHLPGACGISSTKDTFTSVDGSIATTATMGKGPLMTDCKCTLPEYPNKVEGISGVNNAAWCSPK